MEISWIQSITGPMVPAAALFGLMWIFYRKTIKPDIESSEKRLDDRITEVKGDIGKSEERLGDRIERVETRLGQRITEVKTDLKKDIEDVRSDIKERESRLREDIKELGKVYVPVPFHWIDKPSRDSE